MDKTKNLNQNPDNQQQKTNSSKNQQQNSKSSDKKISHKKNKTFFSWSVVLLLLFLGLTVLCFVNKWHLQRNFQKLQGSLDSINYKLAFYKNAFIEKDSLYNKLLSQYNNLLTQRLAESKEFEKTKNQLIELQQLLRTKDSILLALQNSIREALAGYKSDELSVQIKNGKLYITMQEKLLFKSGSDKIPPKGYTALWKLAKVLKKNPNIEILVEGHTDNVPISPKNKRFKDNWDLSVARAVAVVRVLVNQYGIEPERVVAAGRSMYYPVAPNTTPEGRAKNRRIEFILYPNLEALYKISGLEK